MPMETVETGSSTNTTEIGVKAGAETDHVTHAKGKLTLSCHSLSMVRFMHLCKSLPLCSDLSPTKQQLHACHRHN
jgi:hypothetical protein